MVYLAEVAGAEIAVLLVRLPSVRPCHLPGPAWAAGVKPAFTESSSDQRASHVEAIVAVCVRRHPRSALTSGELARALGITSRNLNEVDTVGTESERDRSGARDRAGLAAVTEWPVDAGGRSRFHCSARVTAGPLFLNPPTAVQTDEVGHDSAGVAMS
jgi:hypothetical protein